MDWEKISLSDIYKKQKSDRDIFHDLMPFKVKEVLLIATIYDSYSIVREGQISDKIFGEYLQLNLYAAPRFTSVSNMEEALAMLHQRNFDIIIIMAGLDKEKPLETAEALYRENPSIPILLLANNNADLCYFQKESSKVDYLDRTFVWNGNSNVFLAMIKYVEDKKNLKPDIELGNVRVILLVEDSVQYYSRYLPMLYATIMTQTQNLVEDSTGEELNIILKMRARPKVILVSNYNEAVEIVDNFRNHLLCVISDVKYEKDDVMDDNAGVGLLEYVSKSMRYPIPLLLQSHDISNAKKASNIGADFIDKNSDSLALDVLNFLYRRLGFGNFVFKDTNGTPIMEASNLKEFEEMFRDIPDSVVDYHGRRNSFSTWLIARGEINMAERLKPYQTEDFGSPQKLKEFCLQVFKEVKLDKLKGRIIKFDPGLVDCNRLIIRLGKGSLGGKGRGMAFMSNFIENIDFGNIISGMSIRIPATAVIGVGEFDHFLEYNNLYETIYSTNDYANIRSRFLDGEMDVALTKKLMEYLKVMDRPLAVRSSGLFEDSLLRPFSGVYATYLIPNNHPDINVRFEQLQTAIKLVYSSIFTESAQMYFDAINYKIEEEKMAVIIQEVVGCEFDGKFYPHISGVAHSYNYYPVAYMEPEDGFSVIAVGLGMYVAGGENAFRFCPRYPTLNTTALHDQMRDSQRQFYAIDMTKTDFDLVQDGENAAIHRYRIKEAETDGTLELSVSTYNMENDVLTPGMQQQGPRIVDFSNILKYNAIPLTDTLNLLLKLFRDAMGAPIEMEFAIDLNPNDKGLPTFYLLQIKPMIRSEEEVVIDPEAIHGDSILMYAERGMGNGSIDNIYDVVFVKPTEFSNLVTRDIAREINEYNKLFEQENKGYVLIGPGRWGSNDHFTGIPVYWAGISKAQIIVEIGLHNFPLEGSLGSHFFHNVTSMNVGYFAIPHNSANSFVNMDILYEQETIKETHYIRHVRFKKPMTILMDGRHRQAVIKYES